VLLGAFSSTRRTGRVSRHGCPGSRLVSWVIAVFCGARRRAWLTLGVVGLLVISASFLFWPSDTPSGGAPPTLAANAPALATPSATSSARDETTAVPIEPIEAETAGGGLPRTRDYRALAVAAAKGIYTWDSRTSSFSDVYARLRSWWELLPDRSNPLSVLVREFEGTGVAAGTFAALGNQGARRKGTPESARCDLELAKVQEYPAPWDGLHVCTVSLRVVDESSNGRSTYAAPVTVMMNCPPAITAPADRCAMVGFYATAERIVY
jgi:hypothetical protein